MFHSYTSNIYNKQKDDFILLFFIHFVNISSITINRKNL